MGKIKHIKAMEVMWKANRSNEYNLSFQMIARCPFCMKIIIISLEYNLNRLGHVKIYLTIHTTFKKRQQCE